MAGIRDVAKLAGVGIGTVSRVINNTGYVSKESREKIKAAMKELDYTPNELARNLFRNRTGIIAVLVPTISHPFFAEFVDCVETELHERGYKIMLCNTSKEKNYESTYLQMLKQSIVDGVITGAHSLEVQEYLNVNRPIVALDRYIADEIPVVSVDHRRGGFLAAKELIRCGCKKVVQIMEAKRVQSPARYRHIVFEREMKENGIEIYTYELEWNKFDSEYFYTVAKQTLKEHPDADGMFGTDLVALSYMKAAQERGKKIPEDLKIVAYDGTAATDLVFPRLTVIKQPIDRLAKEAVRLIIHKIEENDCDTQLELEPILIRNGSTKI